jgi:DNA replication licensing factor MCM7
MVKKLVDDIEADAMQYWKIFMEVCFNILPQRDGDFDTEASGARQDVTRRWLEEQADRQRVFGGESGNEVPQKARNPLDIRFKARNSDKVLKMREVNAACIGGLVQLDCLVVRTAEVQPRAQLLNYHCEECGCNFFLSVEGECYDPPKECPGPQCKQNRQRGKLNLYIRNCVFTKHQEVRVQEPPHHVPDGGVPRNITVRFSGDLTGKVIPGDSVTIAGIYVPRDLPWLKLRQGDRSNMMQDMYIDGHSIKKHKKGYNEKDQDFVKFSNEVDEAAQAGSLYERASRSIAPEIYGHGDVKKALLLSLVGSRTKTSKDGMKIRGDIHALLMGDPGVAKSQLLKQVKAIAPRSVYTTGKGSSGVGLTAAVIRDPMTREVSLEGGALVLADTGVCCIDEFDKMDEGDRAAIHEVMEQQSVSIAKSGITTTLNCRTTIVAAANPHFGRYNPYKSPIENIDLPASLISRFDLLFLLLDTIGPDKDKPLAVHVCNVHTGADKSKQAADVSEDKGHADTTAETDFMKLDYKPFDANFMRAYIRKAQAFDPLIEDQLAADIVDAYISMRDDEKRSELDSRKSYTTPRTLQAIMRLSSAHARSRFSAFVQRQDFEEAMRLMRSSKESVEASAPASKGTNPLDLVYDIVADLSRRDAVQAADGWVELVHVASMASNKALTKEQVVEAIETWQSLNVLDMDADKTQVRFLVPPA